MDARLRSDRGERWNRELVRLAASLWPWRGTRRGVQGLVAASIRGEGDAFVVDLANPLQLGLVARLGDTTLLWDEPLVVPGDDERSQPR